MPDKLEPQSNDEAGEFRARDFDFSVLTTTPPQIIPSVVGWGSPVRTV